MIFDKINSFSRIPQIAQIFNTESTENSQRTQRLHFMFIVPQESKRIYDFIELKVSHGFHRLRRFLTQRAQRIHREHKDCILCLFLRGVKENEATKLSVIFLINFTFGSLCSPNHFVRFGLNQKNQKFKTGNSAKILKNFLKFPKLAPY